MAGIENKVGDVVYFGTDNGQRIEWKVISIRDRMALIISSNCIGIKPYHEIGGDITWADCTLRKWLNNEFIDEYFTPEEQAKILPRKIYNGKNPHYNTPGGIPTTDKAFLLSIKEAKKLFADYPVAELPLRANNSWWWLRSPGAYPYGAAFVYDDGFVDKQGSRVDQLMGVRPALWLDLNSSDEN